MVDNNDSGIDFSQLVSALTNKFERVSNKSNVITDIAQTGDDVKYTTIAAVRNWVVTKLSGKQDTISDLASIRSGAELGASALQEGDNVSDLINDVGYLTEHQSLANYYTKTQTDSAISGHHDTTKQDKINDLATIRSGAEKGATAVQPTAIANMVESGDNVSVLTNDVGYLTEHQSLANYYTKTQTDSAIGTAISGVTQFDYEVVSSLPASGVKGKIYLVSNSGSSGNIYDEYIWIVVSGSGKFEKIGTTQIDLSNYFTKTGTNSAIDTKISTHNSSSSAHSTLFANKLEESDLQSAFDGLADAIDDI